MAIIGLQPLADPNPEEQLERKHAALAELVVALRQKDLSAETEEQVSTYLAAINQSKLSGRDLGRELVRTKNNILRLVAKEEKLIPRNYYRNQGIVFGTVVFGIPLGVVFGILQGDFSFMGMGLLIGLTIGLAVGISRDKKAAQEGRQLPVGISL